MALPSHPASASAVLDLLQYHQKKGDNAFMQPLKVALENLLDDQCEISTNALRQRLLKLQQNYYKTYSAHRALMAESIQNGILKKSCRWCQSRGYVLTDTSPPTAGGLNKVEKVELPCNLRLAGAILHEQLLQTLKELYVSAALDLSKLKIYVTNKMITLLAKEGQLPEESVLLSGDWAIFRRRRKGDVLEYILDALWINNSHKNLENIDIITTAAAELHEHGQIVVTYGSRKSSTKQRMRNYGYRWSPQVDEDGLTVNLHCVDGKVAAAEEAVAACLMTKTVEEIVQPALAMYLLRTNNETLEAGGNYWSTQYAFTVNSLTRDYQNSPHKDVGDAGGDGVIIWLHDLESEEIKGGYFVLSTHGVHAEPQHGTVLYLRTAEVEHYSLAPTEGAGQLGIAFAVKKSMLTRLSKLQQGLDTVDSKEERAAEVENEDKVIKILPTVVGKEDINEFWRSLPGMKRFLERFIDKNDKKK